MRTDTIFYELFRALPNLLFALVGLPPELAIAYQFTAVEVKEKAFRFDGIFAPSSPDLVIWFVEVQFQKKAFFYTELITEIAIYLNQYRPVQDWRALVLFPNRQTEPEREHYFTGLYDKVQVVYMDELPEDTGEVGLVKLVVVERSETIALAQRIVTTNPQMLEFVETILIYKFKELSREEIAAMFTLDDFKQTRFYQETRAEALLEGKAEGKAEGMAELSIKILTWRFGELPQEMINQIAQLPLEKMNELGSALLEFHSLDELSAWLGG